MWAFFRSFAGLIAAASLTTFAQGKIDYIIVGGGTAGNFMFTRIVLLPLKNTIGLVMANRLTENPSVQVLVLEAGGNGLGK